MKHLYYIFFSSAIVLLPMVNWSDGQGIYNVSRYFQNMSFGQVHQGGFNISECTSDLLSCWESIVPDIICHQWFQFGTICDVIREYCLDGGLRNPYTERWWHRWFIRENNCLWWWYQFSHSRRAGPPPDEEARRAQLAHHVRYHGSYSFHFVPEL